MTVYIEYVLIENFILDYTLLRLSLQVSKVKIRTKKVLFSACFGALFALIFPLLSLSVFWVYSLKFLMGLILSAVAFPSIKNKNDVGRYAFTAACFFFLSFAFAGAAFAIDYGFSQTENGYLVSQAPILLILCLLLGFCLYVKTLMQNIYKKRTVFRHLFNCAILYNKRRVAILGFLDSGNRASKNGLPVCFISPDIAYEIWEKDALFSPKNTILQEELVISTVTGEKTVRLFQADLEIAHQGKIFTKKNVYFAVSANIISQDYKMLLQANILDEIT